MVYVDDFYKTGIGLGRMKMSHMIADTTDELVEMAEKLGLKREWIQHPNTGREHFDISMSKRALAVKYGAKEIPMRELAKMVKERKSNTTNQ